MTADEKRRQMADLLLEHLEAEKNLAHLHEKSSKVKDRLSSLEGCLSSYSRGLGAEAKSNWERISEFSLNTDYKNLNFDLVYELVKEIEEATAKLDHLSERKSALGI
jgi:hypothetical protein